EKGDILSSDKKSIKAARRISARVKAEVWGRLSKITDIDADDIYSS
ncbi:unnamed protein product, partial [marine sediment metagenome]